MVAAVVAVAVATTCKPTCRTRYGQLVGARRLPRPPMLACQAAGTDTHALLSGLLAARAPATACQQPRRLLPRCRPAAVGGQASPYLALALAAAVVVAEVAVAVVVAALGELWQAGLLPP